jgi:hypothetical protein
MSEMFAFYVRRAAGGNAMKPRIQCVLTLWIPGFIAFGGRGR